LYPNMNTANNMNYANAPNYSASQGYSNNPGYGSVNYYNNTPYSADPTYQIMKDSIMNEVLSEIQAKKVNQLAQLYGYDRILSNQSIQQMIDERYRTLENLKTDIKKELQSIQRLENQRTTDPYIRQAANSLVMEAGRQGVPLDQIIQNLDQKGTPGTGVMSKMSNILSTGQRKGFLYGLGAAVLVYLLWPSARNNLHSVAVRTMEEGMSAAKRAKSSFTGGHHETDMTMDFDDFDPDPHGGHRPPEVDILKQ